MRSFVDLLLGSRAARNVTERIGRTLLDAFVERQTPAEALERVKGEIPNIARGIATDAVRRLVTENEESMINFVGDALGLRVMLASQEGRDWLRGLVKAFSAKNRQTSQTP